MICFADAGYKRVEPEKLLDDRYLRFLDLTLRSAEGAHDSTYEAHRSVEAELHSAEPRYKRFEGAHTSADPL
jgi:hypothetical protein